MSRCIAGALAAAVVFGFAGEAKAQTGRRDRLLNVYNMYRNQQLQRQVTAQQQQQLYQQRDYVSFRDSYFQQRADADPVDRFLREGRDNNPQGVRLPPIYSGANRQRQYFMRITYFNPPRGNR